MKKPLKIFENLYDVLETLPDENWCFYWDAILRYHFRGIEPVFEDEPTAVTLWASIKTLVDLANSDRRSITSPENGKKHRNRNTEPEPEYEK